MSKSEVHVGQSTVAYDHCIGCGLCDAVCPHDAIDMVYTEFKEIQPRINENCTECTTCVKYCPFTNDKIVKEAEKTLQSEDPNSFGLEDSNYYVAYDRRNEKRVKSASGGVVTALAADMLEKGVISAVIHADMQSGKIGEMHYHASISTTVAELESKRSSFYAPISFNEVLKEFYEKEEKILIIGVPCVIRGVNDIFSRNKYYKKNRIYTIALSCSHNVNGQFVDFLAESENISGKDSFKVNLRNKDNLQDANHFNNHYFNDKGTLFKKDRFKTSFTQSWRNYFFTMNVCNKCSDFWGYTADVSIKDAWGRWSEDPLGKSIVVIRNKEIEQLFHKNRHLVKERESFDTVATSQLATTHYKQVEIAKRLYRSKYHPSNILSGYTLKSIMANYSKKWYSKYGYIKTSTRLNYLLRVVKVVELAGRVMNKIAQKKKTNPYVKFLNFYLMKIKNLVSYQKTKQTKQIMITGGYGYKNVGDEAQLNATMQLLHKEFPEYRQVILTHDREYTYQEHGPCIVFDSPREAFFDHNDIDIYSLGNKVVRGLFLLTGFLIYLNAYFVRAGLPTWFINAKKAALLEELKKSDLLFYSGGGYLTGKTLSRLWDGIFFIAYAKVMKVPVVLSGQTIGVWDGSFNRWFAKWGLRNVNIITTRDPEASIQALQEIGIDSENSFVTFDDALFCDKIDSKQTKQELVKSGLQKDQFENYITLNIHYWGIERDKDAQKRLRKRVYDIVEYLTTQQQRKVVLIAMTPTDYITINDYLEEYPSEDVIRYQYAFDFREIRGVIANAKMCVTMKHHPIIFAVGECVPVISLANFDYYKHKNGGALKLFEIEEYNIDFSDAFSLDEFIRKVNYNEKYADGLRLKFTSLSIKKKIFIDKIKQLLGKNV